MEITYLGHASFRLRGKNVAIVTDPFDPKMVGFSMPKTTANIVTISHEHGDHNYAEAIRGINETPPKVLRGPGEYEIQGVLIRGVQVWHDTSKGSERGMNTLFVIELDGIRIAHCGDLGHKLTEAQLSEVGDVHILLVPVGGVYTITPSVASEVVSQLEPKVIIPMHHQVSGLSPATFSKLADVSEFVKAVGITPQNLSSYQAKSETLPEETELVILERKGD